MQLAVRSITLVLDEDFGSRLLSLASRTRVWAVDSPLNRRFAHRVTEKLRGTGAMPLVSLFDCAAGTSRLEQCVNMLYLVEERHGAHRSHPAYGELEVIGLDAGAVEGVRQELARFGFSAFEPTSSGLRAYRLARSPAAR